MNTKRIIKISVFAAILAITSVLSIPTPFGVPLTLQTFAMAFAGSFLGKIDGTISVLIYIILGAIGLPVFSNMSGGISHLFGLSGGFIFGFLFLAFFSGFNKKPIFSILLSFLGLILCHICGIVQFSFLSKTSILSAFFVVSFPYIVKDILSIIFAFFLKTILYKRIKIYN